MKLVTLKAMLNMETKNLRQPKMIHFPLGVYSPQFQVALYEVPDQRRLLTVRRSFEQVS